jgi:hypothetical protein
LRGHLTTTVFPGDITEYALPADCLQIEYVACDDKLLDLVTMDQLATCTSGYAIDGKTIRFNPQVSNPTLRYYMRPPDLKTASTHWLLDLAPDLYLYTALVLVATFSKESDQEAARYKKLADDCVLRLLSSDWHERLADSNKMQTRIMK